MSYIVTTLIKVLRLMAKCEAHYIMQNWVIETTMKGQCYHLIRVLNLPFFGLSTG